MWMIQIPCCGGLFQALLCLSIIILAFTPIALQSETLKVLVVGTSVQICVQTTYHPSQKAYFNRNKKQTTHCAMKSVVFACSPRDICQFRFTMPAGCISVCHFYKGTFQIHHLFIQKHKHFLIFPGIFANYPFKFPCGCSQLYIALQENNKEVFSAWQCDWLLKEAMQ